MRSSGGLCRGRSSMKQARTMPLSKASSRPEDRTFLWYWLSPVGNGYAWPDARRSTSMGLSRPAAVDGASAPSLWRRRRRTPRCPASTRNNTSSEASTSSDSHGCGRLCIAPRRSGFSPPARESTPPDLGLRRSVWQHPGEGFNSLPAPASRAGLRPCAPVTTWRRLMSRRPGWRPSGRIRLDLRRGHRLCSSAQIATAPVSSTRAAQAAGLRLNQQAPDQRLIGRAVSGRGDRRWEVPRCR